MVICIVVYYLTETCSLESAKFVWRENDFKITKFSLGLIEQIMYAVVDGDFSAPSIGGFP
jgi:hypothetical protein